MSRFCKFGSHCSFFYSQPPPNELVLEVEQLKISIQNVLQSLANKESEIKKLQVKVYKLEYESSSKTYFCEDCEKYFKLNSTLTTNIKKFHQQPELEKA